MSDNTIEQVSRKIRQITEVRQKDLEGLAALGGEAREELNKATEELEAAARDMDEKRYQEAEKKREAAALRLSMCDAKYKQVRDQKYVTEAESDEVINSILEFEQQIADEFTAKSKLLLGDLREMLADYLQKVNEAEGVLQRWTSQIHANYSTRGMTSFIDPVTGERTDRSASPVPVRPNKYTGCEQAQVISNFLGSKRLRHVLGESSNNYEW